MYADDIQIFLDFVPTIPGEAACCLHKLSSYISDVQKWMLRNKSKLNEDKTEFFIASSSNHKQYLQNVTLHVNDTSIKSVPTVRNLGVIFNDTMTMSQHVTLSADPSTITYATLEKYANILTMIHVVQLPKLWFFLDWMTVILFYIALPKKILSFFKNSKIMQPVSFISNQNALIRLHFLMSSIGSRYIEGLCIRLLLSSCTKLFLIFRHIIYLSLWI